MIQSFRHEFNNRKNEAIGLISNCKPKFRLDFTANLKRYFNVKIYGQCSSIIYFKSIWPSLTYESVFGRFSHLILNFYDSIFSSGNCDRNSAFTKCESEFLLSSKFFLSFESKNCINYITEKFWRILRLILIYPFD